MSANTGNRFQINNLNLTENTLTITGGNSYRLVVAGTTTLAGAYANVAPNTDFVALELAGRVTGPQSWRFCPPSQHDFDLA